MRGITLCLLCALLGCVDRTAIDNDRSSSAPARAAAQGIAAATKDESSDPAAAGMSGARPGKGSSSSAASGDAGSAGKAASAGRTAAAQPPVAGNAAAGTSAGAAGTGDATGVSGTGMPELVAGTGTRAGCSSYQAAANGKCGSYFCGVDQATLARALNPMGQCSNDPAFICDGRLVRVVGNCARQQKAANLFASNSELRPKVQSCVYNDAEIKQKVPEACLSCFLDAAECAGDNCLGQCAGGDSQSCDQCRTTNNCVVPVFKCAGLPNPL